MQTWQFARSRRRAALLLMLACSCWYGSETQAADGIAQGWEFICLTYNCITDLQQNLAFADRRKIYVKDYGEPVVLGLEAILRNSKANINASVAMIIIDPNPASPRVGYKMANDTHGMIIAHYMEPSNVPKLAGLCQQFLTGAKRTIALSEKLKSEGGAEVDDRIKEYSELAHDPYVAPSSLGALQGKIATVASKLPVSKLTADASAFLKTYRQTTDTAPARAIVQNGGVWEISPSRDPKNVSLKVADRILKVSPDVLVTTAEKKPVSMESVERGFTGTLRFKKIGAESVVTKIELNEKHSGVAAAVREPDVIQNFSPRPPVTGSAPGRASPASETTRE